LLPLLITFVNLAPVPVFGAFAPSVNTVGVSLGGVGAV
jgi:hypothetical protein